MSNKYRDNRYRIWYSKQHACWLCKDTHSHIDYLPMGGFVKILRKPYHGKRGPYDYYAKGNTPFAALWNFQKFNMKRNKE